MHWYSSNKCVVISKGRGEHFVIQFTLLLAKNEAFDLTPIENLFDYSIERDDDEGNE